MSRSLTSRKPVPDRILPIYQQVRFALQRLAHVEFHTADMENGWRVVPPTVAIPARASAGGVLCGARSPALLERLYADNQLVVGLSQIDGMPERIVVQSSSHDLLVTRVRGLGIRVQKEAPASLLSVLPSVRDHRSWHVLEMPETPGWLVHRFSVYPQPQWNALPQEEAEEASAGLFRFVMRHQRFYYLRWRGRTYNIPVQVGKYAVMRRRRGILSYNSERRTLSVPVVFRPPLLMERALVLCSGILPRFDVSTGRLEYSDVQSNVALLASQLLQQGIR